VLALAGCTVVRSAGPGTGATKTAAIDSLFREFAGPDTPGCAVGAARDGEPIVAKGYGRANLEQGIAITPQTAFNIGSVGKQFTALAALLLEQRRRLSLDDDVRRYLPELPDFGTPIRIRDLLFHTSGLRDFGTLELFGNRPVDTQEAFLRLMSRQRGLNFAPGSRHEYAHSDYSILATVVERVAKEPFADFLTREIWAPLGMHSTKLHDDRGGPIPGRAFGYDGSGAARRSVFPANAMIGGSNVYTTIDDLLRWERHWQRPSDSQRALLERMVDRPKLPSGDLIPYAYGLWLGEYRGRRTVHRGGGGGGFHTQMIRFPDQRFAAFVLCNTPADATDLAEAVAGVLLSTELGPRRPDSVADVVATPAEDLVTLPGVYRADPTPWNIVRIIAKGETLEEALDDERFPLTRLRNGQYHSGGLFYRFTIPPSGGSTRLTITARDQREELERAPPTDSWRPTTAALRAMAGTFYSPDVDAAWDLVVERDGLVLRRPGADITLTPVVPGAFVGNYRAGEAMFPIGLEFPMAPGTPASFVATGLHNFEAVRGLRFDRIGRAPTSGL
jgi:CubicO group peptidase (beta-lactamase class C family)